MNAQPQEVGLWKDVNRTQGPLLQAGTATISNTFRALSIAVLLAPHLAALPACLDFS